MMDVEVSAFRGVKHYSHEESLSMFVQRNDLGQSHASHLFTTAWLTRDRDGRCAPPAALLVMAFILFVIWAAGSAEGTSHGDHASAQAEVSRVSVSSRD